MRDPHVVSLVYKLKDGKVITYDKPPPIEHESAKYKLRLADGVLTVDFKYHFASELEARNCVEPFLKAWGIKTALDFNVDEFLFQFEKVHVIDRNPPRPGEVIEVQSVFKPISLAWAVHGAGHASHAQYPSLPLGFSATPDVDGMWYRFQRYQEGKEPLQSMAYAILSLLEGSTGRGQGFRTAVCTMYRIEPQVRDKLGDLISDFGDLKDGGRKLHKRDRPLTEAEKTWIEQVVRALIRRKAEYDHDPSASPSLPLIVTADFCAI